MLTTSDSAVLANAQSHSTMSQHHTTQGQVSYGSHNYAAGQPASSQNIQSGASVAVPPTHIQESTAYAWPENQAPNHAAPSSQHDPSQAAPVVNDVQASITVVDAEHNVDPSQPPFLFHSGDSLLALTKKHNV